MKPFFEGLTDFFKNLAKSLRELADSRRAVLAGLAIIVNVVASLVPQYSEIADKVVFIVDVSLAALAALYTIQPGTSQIQPNTTTTTSSKTTSETVSPNANSRG